MLDKIWYLKFYNLPKHAIKWEKLRGISLIEFIKLPYDFSCIFKCIKDRCYICWMDKWSMGPKQDSPVTSLHALTKIPFAPKGKENGS